MRNHATGQSLKADRLHVQSREVCMQAQNRSSHPLEPFFQQAVRNSYEGKLGLNDPDVTAYVARLLCEFSVSEKLYQVRDEMGHPIEELTEMMLAADPVHGTATSFDAERALRKHIGDYALFVAGMYPEAMASERRRAASSSLARRVDFSRQRELLHRQPVQSLRV
jgi:hypothetical protein